MIHVGGIAVRWIAVILVAAMTLSLIPVVSSVQVFEDPSQTTEIASLTTLSDPTEIWMLEDLYDIRRDLDGDYILMTDIDASATSDISSDYWNGGKGWIPIDSFRGKLDGDGNSINGLFIDRPNMSYVGLFGTLNSGAVVENLVLSDTNVTGNDHVGALAGYNYQGRVSNCTAYGDVTGNYIVGGLLGYKWNGHITNCEVHVDVAGANSLGGLVGYSISGEIVDSVSYGIVNASNGQVGGLVGFNDWSSVFNCEAHGDVTGDYEVGGLMGLNMGFSSFNQATGNVSGREMVGGLIGHNYDMLTGSKATGHVDGDMNIGGLIGLNSGSVEYCYAHGNVLGNENTGGLIGYNDYYGYIIDSYSIGQVTGDIRVGGLVGFNMGISTNSFWDIETSGMLMSSAGVGKMTSEMKDRATFTDAGWNFEDQWRITDSDTYPSLRQPAVESDAEEVSPESDFIGIGMITISALGMFAILVIRARRRR